MLLEWTSTKIILGGFSLIPRKRYYINSRGEYTDIISPIAISLHGLDESSPYTDAPYRPHRRPG